MEHKFNGPLFTLGVEEELMIVDGESMDLVSAIEEGTVTLGILSDEIGSLPNSS